MSSWDVGEVRAECDEMTPVNSMYLYCEQCKEKFCVARWSEHGWVEQGTAIAINDRYARSAMEIFLEKHRHLAPHDDSLGHTDARMIVGFRYEYPMGDGTDRPSTGEEYSVVTVSQLLDWEDYNDVVEQLENAKSEVERLTKLKESYEDVMNNGKDASFKSLLEVKRDQKEAKE